MADLHEIVARAKASREKMLAEQSEKPAVVPKGPPSAVAELFGTIFFRGAQAEPGRFKRWVEMAHRLLGDEDDPHMAFQLQQSGVLDTALLAFESETRTDPGPDPGNLYIAGQNFEFLIGDSWLLFTYEILRTFRASSRYASLPAETRAGLDEIFRLASLVRMPLAKHEAARTRKGKSYVFNVPIHIMHDGLGTAGWRVFEKTTGEMIDVLRRPLADALLLCSEANLSTAALEAISTRGSRELIRIVKA